MATLPLIVEIVLPVRSISSRKASTRAFIASCGLGLSAGAVAGGAAGVAAAGAAGATGDSVAGGVDWSAASADTSAIEDRKSGMAAGR